MQFSNGCLQCTDKAFATNVYTQIIQEALAYANNKIYNN